MLHGCVSSTYNQEVLSKIKKTNSYFKNNTEQFATPLVQNQGGPVFVNHRFVGSIQGAIKNPQDKFLSPINKAIDKNEISGAISAALFKVVKNTLWINSQKEILLQSDVRQELQKDIESGANSYLELELSHFMSLDLSYINFTVKAALYYVSPEFFSTFDKENHAKLGYQSVLHFKSKKVENSQIAALSREYLHQYNQYMSNSYESETQYEYPKELEAKLYKSRVDHWLDANANVLKKVIGSAAEELGKMLALSLSNNKVSVGRIEVEVDDFPSKQQLSLLGGFGSLSTTMLIEGDIVEKTDYRKIVRSVSSGEWYSLPSN